MLRASDGFFMCICECELPTPIPPLPPMAIASVESSDEDRLLWPSWYALPNGVVDRGVAPERETVRFKSGVDPPFPLPIPRRLAVDAFAFSLSIGEGLMDCWCPWCPWWLLWLRWWRTEVTAALAGSLSEAGMALSSKKCEWDQNWKRRYAA